MRIAAAAQAEHVKLEAAAHAEATRSVGEADAHATQAKGLAHAEAVRAQGMAEADSIKARADAMAENQDAVIGQELAQQWPAIDEAAAKPFGAVDQLIVLNGAQGLSEVLAQALSRGATGLKLARGLLGANGLGSPRRGRGRQDQRPRRGRRGHSQGAARELIVTWSRSGHCATGRDRIDRSTSPRPGR